MTDCLTKKLWLAEAELALHRLRIGGAEQTVQFGPSKSVTYTRASIGDLSAYIEQLKREIAACDGLEYKGRQPIRFDF